MGPGPLGSDQAGGCAGLKRYGLFLSDEPESSVSLKYQGFERGDTSTRRLTLGQLWKLHRKVHFLKAPITTREASVFI